MASAGLDSRTLPTSNVVAIRKTQHMAMVAVALTPFRARSVRLYLTSLNVQKSYFYVQQEADAAWGSHKHICSKPPEYVAAARQAGCLERIVLGHDHFRNALAWLFARRPGGVIAKSKRDM